MRVKLYDYEFLGDFLHDWIQATEVNIWNLNFFVFKQSKSKEQVQSIVWMEHGVGFRRKPVNSRKYGPDQQSLYSPFAEIYNVEMEDTEIVRLIFSVSRK